LQVKDHFGKKEKGISRRTFQDKEFDWLMGTDSAKNGRIWLVEELRTFPTERAEMGFLWAHFFYKQNRSTKICPKDFVRLICSTNLIYRFVSQVSISSTLSVQIFRTNVAFQQLFLVTGTWKTTFLQKIRMFNVDEIDYRSFITDRTQYILFSRFFFVWQ